MESIWTETVKLPHFNKLEGNINTDVLIIGGGMAGLLCAYFLREKGVEYTLVEGDTIACGVTKYTTAKITAQHSLIYHKLLKCAGGENTKLYLEANQKALEKYSELSQNIDCDFEWKTSYVYSIDNKEKIEKEADALFRIGYQPVFSDADGLPFKTVGAIGFRKQAQFHPLKFIAKIVVGLQIYEYTFVKGFVNNKAITENGEISFNKVIFATHFPIDNKHGMYFLKMYQHRSYVIALEKAQQLEGMYVDESGEGLSFRNYNQLLLLGGGSHRTGKTGGNWQEIRDFAGEHYPNAVEKYNWSTQDCMSWLSF